MLLMVVLSAVDGVLAVPFLLNGILARSFCVLGISQ